MVSFVVGPGKRGVKGADLFMLVRDIGDGGSGGG